MKPKGTQYFLQLRKYENFAMAPIQFFFELEHLSRIFALESQTMCIIKFTILKKHCHNVMFFCICKYIFTEKYKNSGQVYNLGPSSHLSSDVLVAIYMMTDKRVVASHIIFTIIACFWEALFSSRNFLKFWYCSTFVVI